MEEISNYKYKLISFLIMLFTVLAIRFVNSTNRDSVYKACDFFDSKIGSLIITILGVYWAAQVSLYATELRTQISKFSPDKELTTFIFVISLLMISLLMKEQGQSRRIKIKERKLNNQLTNLPPKRILTFIAAENEIINHIIQGLRLDYLILFSGNIDIKSNANAVAFKKNSDKLIKYILQTICDASSKWDDEYDHQDITYSANIFIPATKDALLPLYENDYPNNPSNKLIESLTKSPFFLFSENLKSKIDHCDGVLFCQKQYSVTHKICNTPTNTNEHENSYTNTINIDHEEKNNEPMVCFPYVKNKRGKHNPNFFGAVQSFVNKEIEYIGNSREVLNDFLKQLSEENVYESYISKSFIEKVRTYYKDDDGKSILSIPLLSYDIHSPIKITPNKEEVHAIVNLYRNKNGMLLTKERAESFYELIRPLCCHLSLVLSLNKALESASVAVNRNYITDKETV